MPADRLHLVRHGEVRNPDHVLYGRLPGFGLSDRGHAMATAAADHLVQAGAPVRTLVCSPLQRTQESAEPVATAFELEPAIDERVIEPTNVFEGRRMKKALMNPLSWWHLRRPSVPSWGEPYAAVVERMNAAMLDAWESTPWGDAVIVSHQLPIWVTHLAVAGVPLRHDPRARRCELSSITTFAHNTDGTWREVGYAEPADTGGGIDVGGGMKRAAAALAVVALALGLSACTNNDDLADQYRSGNEQGFISGDGSFEEIPESERGDPVEFVGVGVDGEEISSEDFTGDVLVINFWYAQCGPCRAEAPLLQGVSAELSGEGVHFLGANIYDGPEQARAFEETYGVEYPSLLLKGDADLKLAFASWTSLQAAPTTLVLDTEGRVAARFFGAVTEESILRTIASDLASGDS